MVVFAFPMFLLVNTGVAVLIMIAIVIAYAVIQNSLAGAQGAWFPDCSTPTPAPPAPRMAYQFSAVVSGFTPFVVTLLYSEFRLGRRCHPVRRLRAIGLVATLITRETFGPVERAAAENNDERQRVDA